ncbi:MAG: hypothetical protein WBO10_00560 [Pyrinomonadaceae bacterium]
MSEDEFRNEMLDFKTQMLRFVDVAGQRFDGLASDIRENSFRLDKVKQRLTTVDQNLSERINLLDQKLSSKLDQVAEKVIDHENRLLRLEESEPASPAVN